MKQGLANDADKRWRASVIITTTIIITSQLSVL